MCFENIQGFMDRINIRTIFLCVALSFMSFFLNSFLQMYKYAKESKRHVDIGRSVFEFVSEKTESYSSIEHVDIERVFRDALAINGVDGVLFDSSGFAVMSYDDGKGGVILKPYIENKKIRWICIQSHYGANSEACSSVQFSTTKIKSDSFHGLFKKADGAIKELNFSTKSNN